MKKQKRVKPTYEERFDAIPNDFKDRFMYICDMLKFKTNDIKILMDEMVRISSIEKNKLSFTIYKEPQATARPRVTRFSVFVPHSQENIVFFKDLLSRMSTVETIITPTKFTCTLYRAIPSNMTKMEKLLAEIGLIRPISRPDWDNLGKTYSDMIQHGLLIDDSLITDSIIRKFFSFKPRIEITLEYETDFNSKYVKKTVTSWKQLQEIMKNNKS